MIHNQLIEQYVKRINAIKIFIVGASSVVLYAGWCARAFFGDALFVFEDQFPELPFDQYISKSTREVEIRKVLEGADFGPRSFSLPLFFECLKNPWGDYRKRFFVSTRVVGGSLLDDQGELREEMYVACSGDVWVLRRHPGSRKWTLIPP